MTATKAPAKKAPVKTAAETTQPAASDKAKRVMTDEHKEALRVGREQGNAVGKYLEAISATTKKKRGRQVTVESLTARLVKAQAAAENASPIERLNLTQAIADVESQLAQMKASQSVDIAPLEKEFIRVGAAYAASKKITRETFVKCGVEKRVLEAAGI